MTFYFLNTYKECICSKKLLNTNIIIKLKNIYQTMNLLDIVKDQVSGSLVSQASKFLGASEDGVGKAMDGIFLHY